MANIEEKVIDLIEKDVITLGYELYDVEYVKEGKDYFLRIYIENEKGIGLDDCEKVSNQITEILDKEDYIKEQYFLEVSSTGVEKVLRKDKHLEKNIESNIEIKLFKSINGKKQYEGILKNFDDKTLVIECETEKITIERKNIGLIKTVYNWEEE